MLVLLILVLLIFLVLFVLILLIFVLLVFLLLLLFFLLFQVFQELLNDVAILGGLLIFWIDSERLSVLFDGVVPVGLFWLVILCSLAATYERVAQVVGRIFAELFIL